MVLVTTVAVAANGGLMCVFLDGMVVRNALDDRCDIVLTQVYSRALDAEGAEYTIF